MLIIQSCSLSEICLSMAVHLIVASIKLYTFIFALQDDTNLPNMSISGENVVPSTSHPMGVRTNVLNRVGHQQDKWKRQVREQRRNIYDRHTMLN